MSVHVDLAKLDELRALDRRGHEGFLKKIGTIFLRDAQVRLTEIERAMNAREAGAVVMAAHALKGSCSYLGALRLGELCRDMEMKADQGDLESGSRAVEEIRSELAAVSAVLTEEMNKA